ncbi:uncharacterized protein LOC134255332 [Saccostrea cucullata]|uniref:uncharacterized protein LOC134255332 n=1 Tax=Saccostrea cuccullata TaxID=36930 RepID=UPI002ED11657
MWPEMKRILSSFDWTEIANFDGTLRVILAVLLILLSVLIKKYILIPPTVKITKSCKSKVKCGEQISLVGNIKSTFSPILSKAWKTPSKRHSPEILNTAKLMIMQSTFEDSGNYELRVSIFFGSTFQNEYLLVGDKPFIRCEKNELRVLYGGSAKLKVSIDSRPPTLSRRWYIERDRNRIQVEFPSEFRTFNWQRKKKYTNMVNKNDDTLLIADCCVLDEGIYYFEASNDFGVSKSANVKLCVEKAPPHVTIEDKSWSRKGLHFVGTVISNSAIKSVSWQKKTYGTFEEIDISNERYQGSNTHSSNPTLIVTNLTVEDDAIYRLYVKNETGEATSDEYRFEVKNANPILTISEEDDNNDMYTKFQLHIRSNKPIKTIKWLKISDGNDQKVIQQWRNTKTGSIASRFPCKTIQGEGCSLVLKDLSKDKARYQVHVCTIDYTETKSNLFEIARPLLTICGEENVQYGENTKLQLHIRSNKPIKAITWFKIIDGTQPEVIRRWKEHTSRNTVKDVCSK